VTKPKRPAAKKREKGAKDTGLLTPEMNNKVDHDDPFEDPERLYAVCSTLICSSTFSPSQHFTKCLEFFFL